MARRSERIASSACRRRRRARSRARARPRDRMARSSPVAPIASAASAGRPARAQRRRQRLDERGIARLAPHEGAQGFGGAPHARRARPPRSRPRRGARTRAHPWVAAGTARRPGRGRRRRSRARAASPPPRDRRRWAGPRAPWPPARPARGAGAPRPRPATTTRLRVSPGSAAEVVQLGARRVDVLERAQPQRAQAGPAEGLGVQRLRVGLRAPGRAEEVRAVDAGGNGHGEAGQDRRAGCPRCARGPVLRESRHPRPGHDEGHAQGRLVHEEPVGELAVIAERLAVIGGHHDQEPGRARASAAATTRPRQASAAATSPS